MKTETEILNELNSMRKTYKKWHDHNPMSNSAFELLKKIKVLEWVLDKDIGVRTS